MGQIGLTMDCRKIKECQVKQWKVGHMQEDANGVERSVLDVFSLNRSVGKSVNTMWHILQRCTVLPESFGALVQQQHY